MSYLSDSTREADRLRELTWGEQVPVDPVIIAHRLGIKVVDATLPKHIPVALVKEIGQDPKILLNARDNVNRKRFSCAYALGRCVAADPEGPYIYVETRGIFTTRQKKPDRARDFALALLTPGSRRREDKLMRAIRFDVPVETLAA